MCRVSSVYHCLRLTEAGCLGVLSARRPPSSAVSSCVRAWWWLLAGVHPQSVGGGEERCDECWAGNSVVRGRVVVVTTVSLITTPRPPPASLHYDSTTPQQGRAARHQHCSYHCYLLRRATARPARVVGWYNAPYEI